MLHQYELFSDMSGKPSIKIADQTTDADPHLFNANVIMNVHHMYKFCNFFGMSTICIRSVIFLVLFTVMQILLIFLYAGQIKQRKAL